MSNKNKSLIKIFLRYTFINTILLSVGIIICSILYFMAINKTKRQQYQDEVVIHSTYIDDYNSNNNEKYVSEFEYKGYILKSIGYSVYLYCNNRQGQKVKADLIKTVYYNKKDKPTDYQILKIYMEY